MSTNREQQTFNIRDLRQRTGELVRDAEAGNLSLVTKHGRPVFLGGFAAKERREVEARLTSAYAGQADALLEEIEGLLGRQSWPDE